MLLTLSGLTTASHSRSCPAACTTPGTASSAPARTATPAALRAASGIPPAADPPPPPSSACPVFPRNASTARRCFARASHRARDRADKAFADEPRELRAHVGRDARERAAAAAELQRHAVIFTGDRDEQPA